MLLSIRRIVLLTILAAIPVAALAQPSSRSGARMVFHEEEDAVILFGGLSGVDSSGLRYGLDDTWRWTGRRWVRVLTPDRPAGRGEFAMVYDSNRDVIVLFGGFDGTNPLSDTWIFDNGNWQQVPTPNSPGERRLPGAAFDPVRDRVVLFGGFRGSERLTDTWEFDGTTWTQIDAGTPEITNPSMVWDEAFDEILMTGVDSTGIAAMYQLAGGTWETLSPTTIPDCVAQNVMVFHPPSGRVISYGGLCSTGFATSETFQWDGSNWGKVDAVPTAGAIFGMAAAYDPNRFEILLFGGDSFGVNSLTFRFVPDRWLLVSDNTRPGPRTLGVFETDTARNVIWLFGGQNESGRFADLWSYQNGRWDRLIAPNAPTGCDSPVGTFDKDRNRLVVVCEDSALFEFDGTVWTTHNPTSNDNKPPARRWSSMVYDERNRRSVLFGGYNGEYMNETWTWNGTAWTKARASGSPPSRALAMMFFDRTTNRVTLYGGIGRPDPEDAVQRYADQWTFDGTAWTEQRNLTTPPARYGAFIQIDPSSNHAIMFGGKDEREHYINEQWEWNGAAWNQVNPGNRPNARMNGMMAFDPTRNAMTMFGGYAGTYFSEVWTLGANGWEIRPDPPADRRRPVQTPGAPSAPGKLLPPSPLH